MTTEDSGAAVPINERVRFWEEQDRINKELIPRVIRQHELLTRHIGEHESLPEVVANAVHKAATAVREEQQSEFDAKVTQLQIAIEQQVETAVQQAVLGAERKADQARRLAVGVAAGAGFVGIAAILLSIVALLGE